MILKQTALIIATLLINVMFSASAYAAPEQIYLFRHGEKQTGSNPALTAQGAARAEHLVTLLQPHAAIELFSSNYIRTLATAAPLAEHFNTAVEVYDARDLVALKAQLLTLQGVVVVIGHSNTTPQLAALLAKSDVALMSEQQYSLYYLLSKQRDTENYAIKALTMQLTAEKNQH
jgi:2,3-bisphosphoglycerate-dependent phosphoglycerate mutase